MKLNKFIKKSVASKFFLMNLIILIFIIGSQIIFQALYFEKYYLNKKEKSLQETITKFKDFLIVNRTDEEIINFMDKIKREENIALSIRDYNLQNGLSLKSYMGEQQVIIEEKNSNQKCKIVLGSQFPNLEIHDGDNIQVVGSVDKYGYVVAYTLSVNGKMVEPYYNIFPGVDLNSDVNDAMIVQEAIQIEDEVYFEGKVEKVIKEDNSYGILSNADLYLDIEEKKNIMLNEKHKMRINNSNNVNEVMLSSEKFSSGYLIAMTPLSAVNDVLGNINNYYFIIFLVAFLIVIIVSLIYSRYMTKPLVEMSAIAKRISECDFGYKYKVKTEDEIGILGESLNQISSNLEKSLNQLQDANEQLKNQMNVKNIQEEKRKELIANISHELKTPITIIQGSINGIKSGMYTKDMYEDILEETNKMNELVREMLEVSKLESPTFTLNKEAFDLCSIFLKEKDKLKPLIKEKNLNITYSASDEAVVFGDEKRINQVITNFLTNAIKYTPENQKIDVKIILNEYNQYVFSIENFGTSLTDEEIEKIWDPFYRTEKSRNKKYGGTGLGLSIVKRILEVHNSEFGIKSSKNSVTFYFTIAKCMAY